MANRKTEMMAMIPVRVGSDGRIEKTCPNGCQCFLCLEFDAGYRAGLEDAAVKIKAALFEKAESFGEYASMCFVKARP